MTALLAFLVAVSAAGPAKELHVRVALDGSGTCITTWNDEWVDKDGLMARARAWPDKESSVHVDGGPDVPYRCLGGTIYALQMAGFSKVGFIAAPPPRRVVIGGDRRCRLKLDGRRITLDALRVESSRWASEDADVHFQPNPRATYQCVGPVLKILKDAGVGKMGFVGNIRAETPGEDK
jgi:biopolymer transport protein ExbD